MLASLPHPPGLELETALLLQEYDQARQVPTEAVALAWLLKHPAGIVPVIGTSQPDRLTACAKSLEVDLRREEWFTLFATARGSTMP